MRLATTAVAILLALATVSCGEDEDSGAFLACREFRGLVQDRSDGLVSGPDMRQRVADIHSDARLSDEPDIASGGRAMHDAAQAGDEQALAEAISSFGSACLDAGHGPD